jgi:predicted kinase
MRRRLLAKHCLILLMGVAGTGKTTLAQRILRHVHAVYLDNNFLVDAFFPNTRSDVRYQRLRPGFYRALYRIAEENLKLNNSVMLDVPHIKEVQTAQWRALIRRLVQKTKARLVVLRCVCSPDQLRRRLVRRHEPRDFWKLNHWNEFLATQPISVKIPFPYVNLDTESNSLSSNTAVAVRYILSQASRVGR